jgi:hypothetical protein
MKKSLLFIIAIVFSIALFSQEKVIIRFENPDQITFKTFTTSAYDVAAFKPGEFLDLVVTEADYQKILSQGYQAEVINSTARMAANLGNVDDINGYRTYDEALEELQEIAANNPSICKLMDIGNSQGKDYFEASYGNYANYQHDIWAIKLSDNVNVDEDEPAVYYFGAHHAREPISTEVAFYVLNYLVDNYGTDPEVTENVNNTEIWFVPIVNPDGHEVVLDQINTDWRKNIRDNDGNGSLTPGSWDYPDGVDPNRNYGWNWGTAGTSSDPGEITYCGPEPFSEPEIQAIRDLMAENQFVAGISYHSYSELVLWPYGYVDGGTAPDVDAIAELGTAVGNSIPGVYGGHYTPQPSWALYPASGITDDWAYGMHGTFAYTVELATEFIPPASQVYQIVEDNLEGALILLNRINYSTLTGHVTNSVTGDPVVAEIYIEGVDNTGLYREPYKSNEDFGTYYRMLTDGSYTVTVSAFGYISQTFENVAITDEAQTILDVALVQSEIIAVNGTVTDSDSGLPIAFAMIEVLNSPLDPVYTDNLGNYVIPEIFENTYTFRVWAMDYATLLQVVNIDAQNNEIDFELTESFAISFEEGTFDPNWEFTGNADWTIDNSTAYDGSFSAKSGNIGNDQSTTMMVSLDIAQAGTVSFFRKVSTESGYDFLEFYIDNVKKDEWAGEMDWAEESYNVNAGTHTFKWVYEKDVYVVGGSDCAWVDFIIFPPTTSVNAEAGADGEVCESENFQCSGNALYYSTLEWTTAGTGTFSDATILDPLYMASTNDIAAGSVTLTLTAYDDEGNSDSDDMMLTFAPMPATPASPEGPAEVCGGAGELYTCDPINNSTSAEWEITPETAGTITLMTDNEITILWSENYAGMANIKVRGMNDCGYGEYSEAFEVEVFDCTGINEKMETSIAVYPNPASQVLTIDFSRHSGEITEVSLVNMLGATIFSSTNPTSGSYISLDVTEFSEGIYFLKIADQTTSITRKIIIQH